MKRNRILYTQDRRVAGQRIAGSQTNAVRFIQYLLLQLKAHTIWRLQFLFALLKTQIPE